MARSLIVLCLVVMSMAAMASATTPKKKNFGAIIVTGKVLCQQGNKPIAGAMTNLTCIGVANGKPDVQVTTLSNPTKADGGYTIGLPMEDPKKIKLTRCRVTLKSSPASSKCIIPTNVNGGIKGAPLSKFLKTKNFHDKVFLIKDLFYKTK